MPHIDPEDLGLLALGEPTSPAQDAHLVDCAPCRAELEELRAAVRVGRETVGVERLARPSAAVWSSVHAELGLTRVPAELDAAPAAGTAPRRRRRRAGAIVVAALGLAAVGVGAVVLTGFDRPRVEERAVLTALPGWRGAEGVATVERRSDGVRILHLELRTPATGPNYRELWLLDPTDSALVSLGVVDEGEGDYQLPAGVDLAKYRVVDVSSEPEDGDPAHSTDSIVRGELEPAAE